MSQIFLVQGTWNNFLLLLIEIVKKFVGLTKEEYIVNQPGHFLI